MDKENDLRQRLKAYALRIIRLYAKLPKTDTAAQVIGRQFLRSGTSVGANYTEATRARSRAEFISKTGDSLKEMAETEYWLDLLVESGTVTAKKMTSLQDETRQLIAILTTINKKARDNS